MVIEYYHNVIIFLKYTNLPFIGRHGATKNDEINVVYNKKANMFSLITLRVMYLMDKILYNI